MRRICDNPAKGGRTVLCITHKAEKQSIKNLLFGREVNEGFCLVHFLMHYAFCVMQDCVPALTFKFLDLLFEVFYLQYSISDALIFHILEN